MQIDFNAAYGCHNFISFGHKVLFHVWEFYQDLVSILYHVDVLPF